jgi:hypothetical protein
MKYILSLSFVVIIIFSCAFSCEKGDDIHPKGKHHKGCGHHHDHDDDKDSTQVKLN